MNHWPVDPEPFVWLFIVLCAIMLVFVVRLFRAQRKAGKEWEEVNNANDCKWWQEQALKNTN